MVGTINLRPAVRLLTAGFFMQFVMEFRARFALSYLARFSTGVLGVPMGEKYSTTLRGLQGITNNRSEDMNELVSTADLVVPENGGAQADYILIPAGNGEQWTLKDADGSAVETITIEFEGVKNGGGNKSGVANLRIVMESTSLRFAANGSEDGLEICGDTNDGKDALKNSKIVSADGRTLDIKVQAKKKTQASFSYKWLAVDGSGTPVCSADPETVIIPV